MPCQLGPHLRGMAASSLPVTDHDPLRNRLQTALLPNWRVQTQSTRKDQLLASFRELPEQGQWNGDKVVILTPKTHSNLLLYLIVTFPCLLSSTHQRTQGNPGVNSSYDQLEITNCQLFQNVAWAGQTILRMELVRTGQPAYHLFQKLVWADQTMLSVELVWTGQPATSCFKT